MVPVQFRMRSNGAMPALQRLIRGRWGLGTPSTAPLSHSRSCTSHASPPGLDKLLGSEGIPRVRIKKGKANLFLEGNPIVYAGAVDAVSGSPASGAAVIVADWKDCAIAWGVYNEHSMYRVRVLQLDRAVRRDGSSALDIPRAVAAAVRNAVALRSTLNLPREDTTVYRLINSEGDNCSGLIVDVMGTHAVAVASAGWVLQHVEAITALLKQEAVGVGEVIWRYDSSMLDMEGVPAGAVPDAAVVGGSSAPAPSTAGMAGDEELLEVVEEGIKYRLNPYGQKTGFYADQRDSRLFLRSLAPGKRVLDLCCYTGAFALNAAAAGAESAVGVDSSQSAVALASRNAALNGVENQCTFVCMAVEKYMEEAIAMNKQFDVVVLDPPKLAPSKKVLPQATQKYTKLNAAAMQLVAPGGVLMTCSCSSAMTQGGDFTKMLVVASRKARRSMTIIRDASAATDHVLNPSFPQGQYLTNVSAIVN